MRDYKIEVWVTAICFILVAVTGGFLSTYFVIANQSFFDMHELTDEEAEVIYNRMVENVYMPQVTSAYPDSSVAEVREMAEKAGEEFITGMKEDGFFVEKEPFIMGFPRHYFWLLIFSWLGATAIGAAWSIVMDRLEVRQRS